MPSYLKFFILYFGIPALYCLVAVVAWTSTYSLSTSQITWLLLLEIAVPLLLSWVAFAACTRAKTLGKKVLILDAAFSSMAVCVAIGTGIATDGRYSPISLAFALVIGGQIPILIWITVTTAIAQVFSLDLYGDISNSSAATAKKLA